MSRFVSHIRPELLDGIRVGLPVGAFDWGGYGTLTNWINGHGAMIIPWTAIGQAITTGNTGTFLFRVAPKLPAVERVFRINMRAESATGVTAAVTVGGAAAVTVPLTDSRDGRGGSFLFRESLGAKTSTVATATVSIVAAGGTVKVESISCYEQTRGVLDTGTDDNGVDIDTLRARDPIFDGTNQSVAGVIDAYKALDARRAGYHHWCTDVGSALSITAGVGAPVDVFDLSIPMTGAIPTLGDTTTLVTVAVLAKVDAGTGTVRFASDDAGDSVNVDVVQTAYTVWATKTLEINCEDLEVTDGRRGNSWEGVAIDAWVTATDTFNIQAISIFRPASANPI